MDINNANDNDTIDLKKLFSLMIEKKKIVIAIIVVCTLIATIVAFVLPKSYQSTTLVRVKSNNDTIDLRKLFSLMIEKKKIVLAIVVICTIIATIVAFVLPKSYQSTTLVRVKSGGSSSAMAGYAAMASGFGIDIGGGSSGSPESYIELMKSREVLEPIIAKLDLPDEDKEKLTVVGFAKKNLEVTNIKKTDLITIAAYGKTPEEAQMISQGVADNFLALMTKLNKEDNSSALKFLDERIKIAKEEMETAENKLASLSAGT